MRRRGGDVPPAPVPEDVPAVTEADAVAGGAVRVTGVGLGEVDTACTRAAAEGEAAEGEAAAEEGAGGAVITLAGGLEEDGELGVGVADAEGDVPRVAPAGYHGRLPKRIGKASRSSAAGTWPVVKGSGPVLPG